MKKFYVNHIERHKKVLFLKNTVKRIREYKYLHGIDRPLTTKEMRKAASFFNKTLDI